jgi:cysteinyl-tRNA synthetase
MLKLYNTLTRKKEIFQPINDKKVGLYCCGPTVYWYAHIGNLKSYIFQDILRRTLEYNGYKVNHIMNYTDVGHLTSDADTGEDKMEKGSRREGKTAWEIADFYIKAFEKDAEALNILEPTATPRATDHIDDQIELIKILEEKGFTYKTKDGIYFDTSKLKDYGKLAMLDEKGLKAGARVEMAEEKKNLTDFALWKFLPKDKKRQMEWDSPWGLGFPGWHIECSAMSQKYLGEQFDIHCGGIDHISVHHTNEIAQSEAAFGKIPARFWLHNEFLLIDSGKMGKSEGNIFTLQTLIDKGFNLLAYRYLVLTAHYRSKLNFTWESIEAAQNALNNLYQIFGEYPDGGKISKEYKKEFEEVINDDLDTPKALALVWKMIKDTKVSDADKKTTLTNFDKVLGLSLNKIKKVEIPEEITKLVQEREKFRKDGKWQEADKIRKQIEEQGHKIEDTEQGPKIIKK